jgi:D-glycero-D-manno-heptose 1,7-bisphosphate phosphatase
MEIQHNSLHKQNKALFLDRDGVLIEYLPYLNHPSQVKIPDGAGEALKKWQDAGYLLIVITNQSGVARGYFTMSDVEAVHSHIRREYSNFGVKFQDILICPHQPSDICKCRKPSPYMIQKAAELYSIELSQSFLIGDAPSDIECAINAGCNPILLLTGRGTDTAKSISHNQSNVPILNELMETVQMIFALEIK